MKTQQDKARHTPTPWHIECGAHICFGKPTAHKSSDILFEAHCDEENVEQRKADAKFVVLACNNHDRLIGALKKIEQVAKGTFSSGDAINYVVQITKEALAALEDHK